jgi:hypothetical protein
MTETFPGTAQILDSKYIADSKLPVNKRALSRRLAYIASIHRHKRRGSHIPSEKQISYTCSTPVEPRAWPQSLDNLKIDHVKEAADQLLFRKRDALPQLMGRFDNVQPF